MDCHKKQAEELNKIEIDVRGVLQFLATKKWSFDMKPKDHSMMDSTMRNYTKKMIITYRFDDVDHEQS